MVAALGLSLLPAATPAQAVAAEHWVGIGPPTGLGSVFVLDPADQRVLYNVADGVNILRSTDAGNSWSKRNVVGPLDPAGQPATVLALTIDPRNSATLYAGTSAGVFKSTDGAATWVASSDGLTELSIDSIVVAPSDSSTLYAAACCANLVALFRSRDAGRSWSPASDGLPGVTRLAVAVAPDSPTTLYVGADGSVPSLFKSTNGGASWTGLGPERGFPALQPILSVVIDPTNPAVVYAGGRQECCAAIPLWKTTDRGASWQRADSGIGQTTIEALVVHPDDPATLYAGGSPGVGPVFRSTNGAASWSPLSSGLPNDTYIHWLAISHGSPKVVYAFGVNFDANLGWHNALYTLQVNASADTIRPSCALTKVGTNSSGQKFIEVTTQDSGSGLQTISPTISTNVQADIPSFSPGTTGPIVVTGTKLDQSKPAQLALQLTDGAGNVTDCDPVLVSVTVDKAPPTPVTLADLPQAEHVLTITNGKPGLERLQLTVNGKPARTVRLRAGKSQTVDLKAAFKRGDGNTLMLTPVGALKATADVLVWDGKGSGQPVGQIKSGKPASAASGQRGQGRGSSQRW
jgi:photosystem II stability/assembly factor-like uncharacterized protein